MILMAIIAAFALALVIVVILLALTAPPPRKDLLEAIEAMRFNAAERAERYVEAYWEQVEEAERKRT